MSELEDHLDDKSTIKAEISMVSDAVMHSKAWKDHMKEHKGAHLIVKRKESSALFPEENESGLVQRIGFDDARHFRAIEGKQPEKIDVFDAQTQRQKGIADLGFQSERHFRFIKTDKDKAEEAQHQKAMPMYGQNEAEQPGGVSYLGGSSGTHVHVSASCDCGKDFTNEANNLMGVQYHDKSSIHKIGAIQPVYAHGTPSSSQPMYTKGHHGHSHSPMYK